MKDEKVYDGIFPNPNCTIAKLSGRVLTHDEYETLQHGLKHCIESNLNIMKYLL